MLRSIWYVVTRGSVFLRRTSIAAMPMPIRSSERNRSSASCCESPIAVPSSIIYNAIFDYSIRRRRARFAVARVFRHGGLLRDRAQSLASEEASYKNRGRQIAALRRAWQSTARRRIPILSRSESNPLARTLYNTAAAPPNFLHPANNRYSRSGSARVPAEAIPVSAPRLRRYRRRARAHNRARPENRRPFPA